MIQFHSVSLAYQKDATALQNITCKISKGEFVFLTGPSGAGKTTLLRLIYGALTPTRGQVLIDGQNISRFSRSQLPFLRRTIGVVFQDFKLLPNRTVFENVAITLEVLGWNRSDISKRVMHILRQMGMESKINLTPQRLSGGEQQRVALARAFVGQPRVLFADEPTGSLDRASAQAVLELMFDLNRAAGTTLVVVTHDEALAARVDRRLTLDAGRLTEHV
jgi:cell division transport system ATP-binding protein